MKDKHNPKPLHHTQQTLNLPHMYLYRSKFGVYYYRYTLPRYIREQHPSLPSSIKRSLQTSQRSEAVYLIARWHAIVHEAITKLLVDGILDLPYTLSKDDYAQKKSYTEIEALEKAYIEEKMRVGSWTTKTYQLYKAQFTLFRKIVGKTYIENITHKDIARYKQLLFKVPSNMNKYPELQGRTTQGVIHIAEQRNMKLLSATTLNKNFMHVKALLLYCYKSGYLKQPLHEHLDMPKNKQTLQRKPFSGSDLEKLFAYMKTESWRNYSKPYQYWLPLLAYYTGARINELCQLHVPDVTYVDDILCININDKNGKQLKNATARRVIPIHDHLIELGFMHYVEILKKMEHKHLFEELNLKGKCKFGHVASKWFANYKKTVGVTGREKVFHSFRHTFANTLKQNGVEEALAAALLGHAYKNITYGVYGSKFSAKNLKTGIQNLQLPIF